MARVLPGTAWSGRGGVARQTAGPRCHGRDTGNAGRSRVEQRAQVGDEAMSQLDHVETNRPRSNAVVLIVHFAFEV